MRISQIQALRALAAILVVLFHGDLVPGGYIGVDIFYVISGYLITGLILKEIDSFGRLNFGNFYQRRIKRLLPASFFVLIVTAIASWFVLPSIARENLGRDVAAAALYLSNYLFALWQNDYQNLGATPSPLIHYWSLAVEEQFYLIWPIVIAILAKGGRGRVKAGVLAITCASLALSIVFTPKEPIWSFYSLPTRAWELGIGACLLFLSPNLFKSKVYTFVGLAGILVGSYVLSSDSLFPGYLALIPVLSTSLLIASIGSWPRSLDSFAETRIVLWLGEISYSLYLWHWPLLILPSISLGRELRFHEIVGLVCLTLLLAHLTHHFIESPLRRSQVKGAHVYGIAIIMTISTCLGGYVIASHSSDRLNIGSITNGPTSISEITRKPLNYPVEQGPGLSIREVFDRSITYSDGCHLSRSAVDFGECAYGDLSSQRTIILFGDSHAAQWFPAVEKIAKEKKIRLVSLTKSFCPPYDLDLAYGGNGVDSSCKLWREKAIARITQEKPFAILMSSLEYYKPRQEQSSLNVWWQDGQRKTVSSLNSSGAALIAIRDTPHPEEDIPQCLSLREPERCMTPAKIRRSVLSDFLSIDPTEWLCSTSCPPIVNGIVAYRDNSHLSVDMSLALSRKISSALETFGVFSDDLR